MEITDVREAVDRFGAAFRTFKTDTGNRIASAGSPLSSAKCCSSWACA